MLLAIADSAFCVLQLFLGHLKVALMLAIVAALRTPTQAVLATTLLFSLGDTHDENLLEISLAQLGHVYSFVKLVT